MKNVRTTVIRLAACTVFCWLLSPFLGTWLLAQHVGINTTNPQHTLDVQGNGFFNQIRLTDASSQVDVRLSAFGGSIGSGIDPLLPSIGTASSHTFTLNTNNRPRVYISAGGLVGIGQPNPTAPLSFASNEANRKIVLWQTQDNDHQFFGLGINSNVLRYQTMGEHQWYRGTDANSSVLQMRLSANGTIHTGGPMVVGNLTASPVHTFQVAGSALTTGSLTVGLHAEITENLTVNGSVVMGYSQVSQTYTVASEVVSYVNVSCPAGTRLISGGGGHRDANAAAADIQVTYSGPDLTNPTTQWRLGVYNRGNASRTIRIYCLCARIL